MPIWFVFDIDVEFDNERFGLPYTNNNPGIEKGVNFFLDLLSRFNFSATFHIQEQNNIEQSISEKYPKIVQNIINSGHEIGLHTHFLSHKFSHRYSELIGGCKRLEKKYGKIVSFRAGNYFTNEATIQILQGLGIKNDTSPWKNTSIANKRWYSIPDSPYHPQAKNLSKPGNSKILIIPISDYRLSISIDHFIPLEAMIRGTKFLIDQSSHIKQPVIIFLTTHSWKVIDPTNYSLRQNIIKKFEDYFTFIKDMQIPALTVKEVGARWRQGDYQHYTFRKREDVLQHYLSIRSLKHYFPMVKCLSWLKYPKFYLLNKL